MRGLFYRHCEQVLLRRHLIVIASDCKERAILGCLTRLPRRFAPRNDDTG
ncbi:hypothetical protein [Rickettsia hoogstraalii]|nr:hypothetical protein [Rickettsia hoogstraalii]